MGDVERDGFIGNVGSMALRRYKNDDDPTTFGDLADRALFEMERLQVEQVVPEIAGKNALGTINRLSDHRGKVVLLFFGATDWGRGEIFDRARALKDKYPDQFFEVFTVMMNSDVEPLKTALDDGKIDWPTVFDGTNGPISTQWNARTIPSDLFLIDPDGKIKRRLTFDEDLELLLDRMIKRAAK